MASVHCSHCGRDNPPEARFCANCGSSLAVPTVQVPAPTPVSTPTVTTREPEYAGFWIRFAAYIIDCVILFIFALFIFFITHFIRFFFFMPFSGMVVVWLYFWLFTGLKGQTPGKMAVGIKVVNAGGTLPGLGIAALREILGKIVSSLVFYLGYLWIIWDGKKQGWHDKIGGTYVIPVKTRR
jgi:uncharacterized RDD family membrane protein YckC